MSSLREPSNPTRTLATQPDTPLGRRKVATRRAVIAALVVLCVVVFSVFARESGSGPLHAVQGAVGTVASPIQDVTSKAVKPLRDLWGWGKDMRTARDRVTHLEQENRALRTRIAEGQFEQVDSAARSELEGVGDRWKDDYEQLRAMIITRSQPPWYERAELNVGTADGAVVGSPVLAPNAQVTNSLAGVITRAGRNRSTVTFITEQGTGIGVYFLPSRAQGLAQPSVSGQLQVSGIPRRDNVRSDGDIAYTSGASRGVGSSSPFPRGIPVGWVSGAGHRETDQEWTVQLSPFVRPSDLSYVVVLAPSSDLAKRRAQFR